MAPRTERQSANIKRYRERHKDRLLEEGRQRYRTDVKRYVYHMLKRAEKRAKDRGIPFDITVSDIVIPEICPILNIKLEIGKGKGPSDSSPSLDRIDPSKGYVEGNVMVISMRANKIKSDVLIEDIERVLEYLKQQTTK
jgi:hypothetical protein